MGPNCDSKKLICPRVVYLETDNATLRQRLSDCERSLTIYDDGLVSEYWMRYGEPSTSTPKT